MRLSSQTLAAVRAGVGRPRYDRAATRLGIVHFGPGAFHRAHQAWYADRLLARDPRWAISAVSLKSAAARDALTPQDFLYSLVELGTEARWSVIGALRELWVAAEQGGAVLKRLASPDARLVTVTVTEKGYCLDAAGELDEHHPDLAHDLSHPHAPLSLLGWLAAGLRVRRAQGLPPFAIVSCDNLADNGPTLRRALVAHVARLDAGLARWIADEVPFPRTMVDSITPATDEALRERAADALGLADAWPVQREAFTQWVIEDLPAMREADWAAAGVTLASDVGVYERAKLRLVNGAHSTLAYVGLLRGRATVAEAMSDAPLASFVERLMREDIAPTLGRTGALAARDFDVSAYIGEVLERFRNPAMRHLLSQIAWDGSMKLPVRLLGTIEDRLLAGQPIARLAVPIAAWMRFVARQSKAGEPIVDPDAERLAAIGRACTGEASDDVERFIALGTVIPPGIAVDPTFRRDLESAYRRLGSAASLDRLDVG